MLGDTFSYRLFCVNAPTAADTNAYNLPLAQKGYPSSSPPTCASCG